MRIGRHAILGTNVVVFPGVVVGDGCAVAAGSVVSKALEPWGVYAGSPARRVKARPKDRILELERELRNRNG